VLLAQLTGQITLLFLAVLSLLTLTPIPAQQHKTNAEPILDFLPFINNLRMQPFLLHPQEIKLEIQKDN